CRGREGNAYPWGNDLAKAPALRTPTSKQSDDAGAWDVALLYRLYRKLTVPVDCPDPVASPNGIAHMYDNVSEITATVDVAKRDVIMLGRCYADPPGRPTLGQASSFPLAKVSLRHGFRCACSAARSTDTR